MTEPTARRQFLLGVLAGASAAAIPGRAQSQGHVTGFDHVALPMQDSDAMGTFYRALGFTTGGSAQLMTVHFGDHKINFHAPALWQRDSFTLRGPTARPGCGDLCFVWDGTLQALAERLTRAGATIIEGPAPRTGGRNGGRDSGTSVYVRDPDRNLLEFIVYP